VKQDRTDGGEQGATLLIALGIGLFCLTMLAWVLGRAPENVAYMAGLALLTSLYGMATHPALPPEARTLFRVGMWAVGILTAALIVAAIVL
jgi:4-hydroxybenzoate polyprenyltransferase